MNKRFYKYCSPETAIAILKSRALRFSSPVKFNDPFDIQTEIVFGHDEPEFCRQMLERSTDAIKQVLFLKLSSQMSPKVAEAFLSKGQQRSVERIEYLTEPILVAIRDIETILTDHWRKLLNEMRVFCVSEANDSVLMWSHYGSSHQGVCLELQAIPHEDNALCVAKKVKYIENPPTLADIFSDLTVEQWVKVFSGEVERLDNEKFKDYVLYKAIFWSYEKEWRVWAPIPDQENQSFTDVRMNPNELSAVYFGCKCNSRTVSSIIQLSKEINSNVKFYRGHKNTSQYKIDFNPMDLE